MTVEPCNNTSVGILVVRDQRLLLIERAKPPYGWAPPAGHVDDDELYIDAAPRELREETGLVATTLRHVLSERYDNQCRRPSGDHHYWMVYEAGATGDPVRSEYETNGLEWVSARDLADLAEVTREHLAADAGPDVWQANPGLEPVWLDMLTELGWIGGAR